MYLDMYLTGNKYLFAGLDGRSSDVLEDGYRLRNKDLELGYWYNHPRLHKFITQRFSDGEYRMHLIELNVEAIHEIIHTIQNNNLPEAPELSGVPEAQSSVDPKYCVDTFLAALKWLQTSDDLHWRAIHYQATW